jgi:hypothetical protein
MALQTSASEMGARDKIIIVVVAVVVVVVVVVVIPLTQIKVKS